MSNEIEREYLEYLSSLYEAGLITKENMKEAINLAEVYRQFQEKAGKEKEEIFSEVATYFAEKILMHFIEKKMPVFLDETLLEKLKRIPFLKLSYLGGKTAAQIVESRLFLVGFFGLTDDQFITTGYFKSRREDPFIPTNLVMAYLGSSTLYDDENLRNMVINKIKEMYGLPQPKIRFKSPSSPEMIGKLDSHLKYLVFRIKHAYKESFECLQDSLVFYNRSLALYTRESVSMNIFSTSSGIVIPEEYRGDVLAKKNPYRRKYFDRGIASASAYDLPKFYQWDSETTPKNLYKGFASALDKESYKNEAVQILSRFLMLPNFEITEAPFIEDPWKIYFTLVSDKSIVFSERGEMRKINHGYIIDEDILKLKKDVYNAIATALWKRENGIIGSIKKSYKRNAIRTYKDLNQVCKSQKEAEEMARDIVELLLEDGKRLVEKDLKREAVLIENIKSKYVEKPITVYMKKNGRKFAVLLSFQELQKFLCEEDRCKYELWYDSIYKECLINGKALFKERKIKRTPHLLKRVLELLIIKSPEPVSYKEIFEKCGRSNKAFEEKVNDYDVRKWISLLRKEGFKNLIETVHLFGYRWKGEGNICIIDFTENLKKIGVII